MKKRILKGNYFEIGKQQGKIYRENGLSLDKIKVNKELLKKQLKVYKKYYPEILEELNGIAKAGKFEKDKIFSIYLTGEIFWFRKKLNIQNCTIFGIKNKNGCFTGRNLDWVPITSKVMEIYTKEIENKNKFIGISDMLISSKYDVKNRYLFHDTIDAINEHGLYTGITFAYCEKYNFGLSFKDINKYIMEHCSTVSEAISIFKKIPLSVPKNFFIADTRGNMAVVEHTSEEFRVLYPENNVLIQTNHFIHDDLKKYESVLKQKPDHNTFIRYYKTLQKINQNKENIDFQDIFDVSTASFQNCEQYNIKTIWSLALDMKNKKYKMFTDVFNKKTETKLQI
jgi:predicted choloylglycine hydrolase